MRKTFRTQDIIAAMEGGLSPLSCHIEGDWISDDKYEFCEYILKEEATGLFYKVMDSRTGSYYSEWFYDSNEWPETKELTQVMRKEVTVTEWVNTK